MRINSKLRNKLCAPRAFRIYNNQGVLMNLTRFVCAVTAAPLLSLLLAGASHAQLGAAPLPKAKAEKPTGPSLEETMQWITQKLEASPTKVSSPSASRSYQWQSRLRLKFVSCNEVFFVEDIRTWQDANTSYVENKSKTSLLSLADVDPEKLRAYQYPEDKTWNISIYSLGLKNVFYSSAERNSILRSPVSVDLAGDLNGYNDQVAVAKDMDALVRKARTGEGLPTVFHFMQFTFPDFESGDRVVNALKHASLLCRQKAASEKAAQPPKPKEIF